MSTVVPTGPGRPPRRRVELPPRLRLQLARASVAGRSALREFVVIVAGVLVALGAQAWWEGRQEQAREHAYLVQLLADTRENAQRLDAAIAEDSAAVAAMSRALVALDGAGDPPPADSLMQWILLSGRAADFQPVTGTYRALLGTGDLRLVRNDSLRALVVRYAASIDSESQRSHQLRGVVLDATGAFGRAMPFVRRVFQGGPTADQVDVEQLRSDGEAAALMFTLQAASYNRINGLARMREETGRLRRALEAEPGLRGLP